MYGSQVVPHLATRHTQQSLTAEFKWYPVFPLRYDRKTIVIANQGFDPWTFGL